MPTTSLSPTPTRIPVPALRRQLEASVADLDYECQRWTRRDEARPFEMGTRAAIQCDAPVDSSDGVEQIALYVFGNERQRQRYWSWKMNTITPPPEQTTDACGEGLRGIDAWDFGEVACYVEGGAAKIRWTDDRTESYGLVNARHGNIRRLFAWWLANGRPLGEE